MKKGEIKERILEVLSLFGDVGITKIGAEIPEAQSLGSITYQMDKLNKEGKVKKVTDRSKPGRPIAYEIADKKIKERAKERAKQRQKEEQKLRKRILEIIKEKNKISGQELTDILEGEGFKNETIQLKIKASLNEREIVDYYGLSEKGKALLKSKKNG